MKSKSLLSAYEEKATHEEDYRSRLYFGKAWSSPCLYGNPKTGKKQPVPRHDEIDRILQNTSSKNWPEGRTPHVSSRVTYVLMNVPHRPLLVHCQGLTPSNGPL